MPSSGSCLSTRSVGRLSCVHVSLELCCEPEKTSYQIFVLSPQLAVVLQRVRFLAKHRCQFSALSVGFHPHGQQRNDLKRCDQYQVTNRNLIWNNLRDYYCATGIMTRLYCEICFLGNGHDFRGALSASDSKRTSLCPIADTDH